MRTYESPAKVNLSLHVEPPSASGYHPLQSLVQTVEWCDLLSFDEIEESSDVLEVEGEVPEEGNLVTSALALIREFASMPTVRVVLEKRLPVGAGLGGGSSNAAAVIRAAHDLGALAGQDMPAVASRVGADVSLFLRGGAQLMTGVGEVLTSQEPLEGFALAVVVPDFPLSTAEVYRKWDQLEGPVGDVVPDAMLPPVLRDGMPIRNDLLPAALALEPRLGDFMADVRAAWDGAVCLTGSGSACFGFFVTVEEAEDAVEQVASVTSTGRGVMLRGGGVTSRD